ncbi:MAG: hypothetical protein JSS81_18060 [Acidobacteria bacterium]|nr:hypothetical protein [Acidobacteriota bacterium]
MKKFIVDLVSNRFGIVLATLNVCFLAGKYNGLFELHHNPARLVFSSLNAPALIASGISYQILKNFLFEPPAELRMTFIFAFVTGFIVLQWLAIAWFARRVALRFRRPEF